MQNDWSKPAAMAIPKGGFVKDKVEQGRYGPIFPKTPACYGFSILAKIKPGTEQNFRDPEAGLGEDGDGIFGVFIEVGVEDALIHEVGLAFYVEQHPTQIVQLEHGGRTGLAGRHSRKSEVGCGSPGFGRTRQALGDRGVYLERTAGAGSG